MTQLNKAVIGAIRVVMACEWSGEKILTVSKDGHITGSESQSWIAACLPPFTHFSVRIANEPGEQANIGQACVRE